MGGENISALYTTNLTWNTDKRELFLYLDVSDYGFITGTSLADANSHAYPIPDILLNGLTTLNAILVNANTKEFPDDAVEINKYVTLYRGCDYTCKRILDVFKTIEQQKTNSGLLTLSIDKDYSLAGLKKDICMLIESMSSFIFLDEFEDLNDYHLIETVIHSTLEYAVKSTNPVLLKLVDDIELIQCIADKLYFGRQCPSSALPFYDLICAIIERKPKESEIITSLDNYWLQAAHLRKLIKEAKDYPNEFNVPYFISRLNNLFPEKKGLTAILKEYILYCLDDMPDQALIQASKYARLVSKTMYKEPPEFRILLFIAEGMRQQMAFEYLRTAPPRDSEELEHIILTYGKDKRFQALRYYIESINSMSPSTTEEEKHYEKLKLGEAAAIRTLLKASYYIELLWSYLKLSADQCLSYEDNDNYNNNNYSDDDDPSELIKSAAYYTSLKTLGYFLPQTSSQAESGFLSMMHLAYMNDPNEGVVVPQIVFEKVKKEFERESARYPYVFLKSFTTRIDDLPMWEIYGDHAKGVCVVIDPIQFAKKTSKTSMYRVCYLTRNGEYYTAPHKHNRNFDSTILHNIEALLYKLQNLATRNAGNSLFIEALHIAIQDIRFMFKDADYSHECELRLVYTASDHADPRIKQTLSPKPDKDNPEKLSPVTYDDGAPPLLYVSCLSPLEIDEIILGPKFENSAKELPFLERRCDELTQLNKLRSNSSRKKNIRISFSDIDYR